MPYRLCHFAYMGTIKYIDRSQELKDALKIRQQHLYLEHNVFSWLVRHDLMLFRNPARKHGRHYSIFSFLQEGFPN